MYLPAHLGLPLHVLLAEVLPAARHEMHAQLQQQQPQQLQQRQHKKAKVAQPLIDVTNFKAKESKAELITKAGKAPLPSMMGFCHDKNFVCAIEGCGRQFADRFDLKRHMFSRTRRMRAAVALPDRSRGLREALLARLQPP
jgi:hypothetical protein